ncbi:putative phosphoribosylaminoimidazole-succinocarboxamide synthase [Lasiosphaeris hirsuta]|uniref:Phosphoribosylaminoimidazole-succinocarboxamide synthase n=1 Tax=Lasiosphaeris hirsuta TaxID=260670 RepID=A0AA40B979_9PEZI|nr:putative phosphoribosylaminoimidazole-succinocarboxamide synthase [Lasiosphaeris hirsuta]
MASPVVTSIALSSLPKLTSGKVRDLFEIDSKTLLFATTDRISAYDVIMANGVPFKGAVLTQMSAHWFRILTEKVPGLKTHFLTLAPPTNLSPADRELVRGRSMQVRKLKVFPIEIIVRGYITGSAWKEYQKSGTVHGLPQPAGLQQCSPFLRPIYTPSTKAELGQHDENITPAQAAKIVGERYADRIEKLALQVYEAGAAYALERGIIIADTKFEFGLDEETDDIVLIDEVLTPDSSRFWPADGYEAGREQASFDKQPLRDWLTETGLQDMDGVAMTPEIADSTSARYKDAFKRLTGKTLEEALAEL